MRDNTNDPTEQHSITNTRTRRGVLKGSATIVGATLTQTAIASGADADGDADESGGRIPAPFDEMPTLEDPPEEVRELGEHRLPPWAVPDEGPIPDWHHHHTVEREIAVPEWALEATRFRLSHNDPDDIDRWRVEEFLFEYAYITERFLTPDGRDAVDVLLKEFGDDGER